MIVIQMKLVSASLTLFLCLSWKWKTRVLQYKLVRIYQSIENKIKNYVEIISSIIDELFPLKLLAILKPFSIFDASQIPSGTRQEFKLYDLVETMK